jgi:acyl dehydratase
MPVTKVIRYQTRPEHAAENERLIRDVFAELAAEQPEGLRYASFRLDDGVSFVHVAVLDGDQNPLSASAAFATFQSGITDRCADGPHPSDATMIGSYGSVASSHGEGTRAPAAS